MPEPLDPLDSAGARRPRPGATNTGNPAPDPGRVAGHFAGVGDGDLLDLAARDEAVRRLLVDVAVVVADVLAAGEVDSEVGTAIGRPSLPADVRARALAAFAAAAPRRAREPAAREPAARAEFRSADAPSADAPPADATLVEGSLVDGPSLDAARRRRRRWGRAAIAAAVLLVPGIGLAVSNRAVEAASLSLEGFDRVGAGGDVETGGPRRLAIGQRVAAGAGERVALRLVGGTRVVLADRAQMAIGCDTPCDGGCGGPVFDVETGGVVVAAAAGPSVSPVAVRVRSTGRVDVWSGAARLDRDGAGAVSLSLRSDARVRWSPEGGVARELVGPAVLSFGKPGRDAAGAGAGAGVRVATTDRDGMAGGGGGTGPGDAAIDAAAFRDLEFFGGPLRRLGDEVRVGCRRWRIVEEGTGASAPRLARARRSEMGGAPAIRFEFDAGDEARVAWPADAPAYGARRVEVRFRARSATSSGPGVASPTVRVRLEGVPGAEGFVSFDTTPAGTPAAGTPAAGEPAMGGESPRLLRALLPLPASFADAPSGLRDLVLSFTVEGGSSTVWFESVVFLEVGAADGASR